MTPRRTRGPQRAINPHGLTPKQAARHLGISQTSLAWAANAGAIPRVKRGRGWTRYLESDLALPEVQETARQIRDHEAAIERQAKAMETLTTAARKVVLAFVAMGNSFGKAFKRAGKAAQKRQAVAK